MKLFAFTFALLCATGAVFAQSEETTTLSPTTQAPSGESAETTTEVPTTIAPESQNNQAENVTQTGNRTAEGEQRTPMEQVPMMGGRNEPFFPNQNDPRVMFIPQTVRDPVTGMIYHRRVPHFPHNEPFRPHVMPPTQPSFDPLGTFTEHQKKRQFFQDLLMTQLSRFEKEIDPMMEGETEEEQKAGLISILQAVNNLKKALETNQIFNISEIMKRWKEGKLPGQTAPPTLSGSSPQAPPAEVTVAPSVESERPAPDVVAVAEANPPVRAIFILPQRREPQILVQRQPPQHPLYIRRFAIPRPDERNLPHGDYTQEDNEYLAGY